MATTPDLIAALVASRTPVRRRQVERRLAAGVGLGVAVSAIAMLSWLGLRPDLAQAIATGGFWVKLAYTLLLALCLGRAVERLSRPAAPAARWFKGLALVVAGVALLAVAQLAVSPPYDWPALVMGQSADKCPWLIVLLAFPPLIGAVVAMRSLAPTRLLAAGCTAGLMSGALGALVYSFHCDEFAVPFLAIWYSLGVALVGGIGAAVARPLLRW